MYRKLRKRSPRYLGQTCDDRPRDVALWSVLTGAVSGAGAGFAQGAVVGAVLGLAPGPAVGAAIGVLSGAGIGAMGGAVYGAYVSGACALAGAYAKENVDLPVDPIESPVRQ